MTLTRDDAQMLATLAVRSRPNGARRWDHAGVMAALEKVRDRSLPEVVMATIRAAADRAAETPGVIPTAGSHWAETAAVRAYVPDSAPAGTRCTVCGKSTHRGGEDHDFHTPRPADPETVAAHVASLKAELAPTAGPTQRRSLEDLAEANPQLHDRLERVRALIPDAQMREDEVGDE